ncbi:MAG: hypothetical protein K8T89_11690 [Planctomycetes bacterium]|nr:hypothetical protein [Planctomycetota bacterium]
MRELVFRILRRGIPVGIALAVMGYIFAEIFLMMMQMGGAAPIPENNAMRWKTPLSMAGFGVGLLAIFECISFAVRRNRVDSRPSVILDQEIAKTEPKQ